jgi:hypothetical protein
MQIFSKVGGLSIWACFGKVRFLAKNGEMAHVSVYGNAMFATT